MAKPAGTLDAEVGGASANSYITIAEADEYHSTHRNNSAGWAGNDAVKSAVIIMAMMLIETRFTWKGTKAESKQSLDWPRYYAYDENGYLFGYDYNSDAYIIPDMLKNAVAELAFHLLISDRTADSTSAGLKGLTVDVIKLEFDPKSEAPTIPESVHGLLTGLGSYKGPGSGVASLVRT